MSPDINGFPLNTHLCAIQRAPSTALSSFSHVVAEDGRRHTDRVLRAEEMHTVFHFLPNDGATAASSSGAFFSPCDDVRSTNRRCAYLPNTELVLVIVYLFFVFAFFFFLLTFLTEVISVFVAKAGWIIFMRITAVFGPICGVSLILFRKKEGKFRACVSFS